MRILQENTFREFLLRQPQGDSAHDIAHVERVVCTAKKIALKESAHMDVVVAAAWLHDCVTVPKDSPLRSQASKLSAQSAAALLHSLGQEESMIKNVSHAIEAHSFSANIQPHTLEAKVVQDADRLDALGAIGVARCLLTGGSLGRSLYHTEDPFCLHREPQDMLYSIDHFYTKLFKITKTLNTESARKESVTRMDFMKAFLAQLESELPTPALQPKGQL